MEFEERSCDEEAREDITLQNEMIVTLVGIKDGVWCEPKSSNVVVFIDNCQHGQWRNQKFELGGAIS